MSPGRPLLGKTAVRRPHIAVEGDPVGVRTLHQVCSGGTSLPGPTSGCSSFCGRSAGSGSSSGALTSGVLRFRATGVLRAALLRVPAVLRVAVFRAVVLRAGVLRAAVFRVAVLRTGDLRTAAAPLSSGL